MTSTSSSLSVVPPLENGDHLTCQAFERRYYAMSQIKKMAEHRAFTNQLAKEIHG